MAKQRPMFDGPIPGENYTSDTKNYPWHRPPEYTDLNQAIEAAAKKLTSEEGSVGMLTMIENGLPISALTQTFIMSGVASGKWTLDYGLLMAGPVARIMCMMAEAYDVDYDLGIDNPIKKIPTKAYFKALSEEDTEKAAEAGETVGAGMEQPELGPSATPGGFMGGAPGIEQMGTEAPDPETPVDDKPVMTQGMEY